MHTDKQAAREALTQHWNKRVEQEDPMLIDTVEAATRGTLSELGELIEAMRRGQSAKWQVIDEMGDVMYGLHAYEQAQGSIADTIAIVQAQEEVAGAKEQMGERGLTEADVRKPGDILEAALEAKGMTPEEIEEARAYRLQQRTKLEEMMAV